MRLIVIISACILLLITCKEEEISIPVVQTGSVVKVSTSGVTFHGKIQNQGKSELIDYGFVWDTYDNPTINNSYQKSLGNKFDQNFEATIQSALIEETTYFVRAYITDSERTIYGRSVSFVSLGSLPMKLFDFFPREAAWNDSIIFKGENFSTKKSDIKISFGTQDAQIVKTSDSLIIALVPDDLEGINSLITIQSKNQTEGYDQNFSLLAPVINEIAPESGTYSDEVTVMGNYFKSDLTDVYIGNIAAKITSITSQNLVVEVPSGVPEGNTLVKVSVLNQEATVDFYSAAPRITSVSVLNGTWGDEIIIEGLNFSNTLSDNKVYFDEELSEILENTEQMLKVKVPNTLIIQNASIGVEVKEQTSIFSESFQLIRPVIFDFSPKNGTFDDVIEITGNYFNPDQSLNKIFFDTVEANIIEATTESIRLSVPRNYHSINGKTIINLQIGELEAFSVEEFALFAHQIGDFPLEVNPNNIISITGENFNPYAELNVVTINEAPVQVLAGNRSALEVLIPMDVEEGNQTLSVSVAGVELEADINILRPWVKLDDPPFGGRTWAISFADGSNGYLGGGISNDGRRTDFWKYDPELDRWEQINQLPFSTIIPVSVAAEGGAFINTKTETWSYATNSATWTQIDMFPFNDSGDRMGFGVDKKIYFGGGLDTPTLWEYDTESKNWQEHDFPVRTSGALGFSMNGKGYFITGIYNSNIYEFDTNSNRWSLLVNLSGIVENIEDYRQGAVGGVAEGKIYFGLGREVFTPDQDGFKTDFYCFDPNNTNVKAIMPFPGEGREHAASFTIGDDFYIIGGSDREFNRNIFPEVWKLETSKIRN